MEEGEITGARFDVSGVDKVELLNQASDKVYVYPEYAEGVLKLRLVTSVGGYYVRGRGQPNPYPLEDE